jgi:molybdopterin molybdotransferase
VPTFEEARSIILKHVNTLGVEPVMLMDSLGRVLGQNITAPWNMPPCSNSAMDGYAVRAADCQVSQNLPIVDYIPAGSCSNKSVQQGTAIKIMTGAPIPSGCDSIVPLEDARESDGGMCVQGPVALHQHVRFAGEDICKGETVLQKGTVIRPIDISVLASFGSVQVKVFRKPKVAVVATGDELLELGEIPSGGKVVNSNSYSLAAAIKRLGATPVILGISRDNLESHREKLKEGLKADALITSAGVSVGDRDLVRDALGDLGVVQVFWRVDVKPGKALAFGMKGETPVFALPGNPVSAMLTFEEFVAPALLKVMGHSRVIRQLFTAELQHDMTKLAGRTQLARVQVKYSKGKYLAWSAGKQATGYLKTLLQANAIAVLPAERTTFVAGDPVQVHLLDADY